MTKLLASCIVALFTFALAPLALKASPLCPLGNGTLHGTYIVSGAGTAGGAPIAAVGEITWDGEGNTIATYTASLNGDIHKGVTVTGTYSINQDCTGSHAESDGSHYDFVAFPDGHGTTWISTDNGASVTGTTVRLKPVESTAEARFRSSATALPPARFQSGGELISHRRSDPQKKRSETQRRHEAAKRQWRNSSRASSLEPEKYDEEIQPRLASVPICQNCFDTGRMRTLRC